jgi:adenylate cyclase
LPELGFGIALHVGEVMYGNIGSRTRLDFTVIGPAVNLVSRLEELTRVLDREVIVSEAFAQICDEDCMVSLGTHELRGVGRAVEVYALKERGR